MIDIKSVDGGILKGHSGKVWDAKWNPEGTIISSCGEDKKVILWVKNKIKAVLQDAHQKTIRSVAWSPCGQFLASASFDGTVAIWDNKTSDFECNATVEGHENEVKSAAWSQSGRFLATCSRDKTVWIWEVENDDYECASVLNAHSQDVKKVAWNPVDDILASASYDNTIKIFIEDPSDGEWSCASTLKSHENTVWSIDFNKDGSLLASCSADETVKIWKRYLPGNKEGVITEDNNPTWKCACTLSGFHDGPIYDIAWNHSNDLIATACSDNTIRVFKIIEEGAEINLELIAIKDHAHEQDVNSINWHPTESNKLVTASDDSTVRVWILNE